MNIIIFNLFSSFFRLSLPWTRPNTGEGCSTWEPQWMEMKQWKNLTHWKTMQLIISDPRQRLVLFYFIVKFIELHILKRLARLKIYQTKVKICKLFSQFLYKTCTIKQTFVTSCLNWWSFASISWKKKACASMWQWCTKSIPV